MRAAEEMVAGANFLEGIQCQRIVVHRHACEIGMQSAAIIGVDHEFLIGHGQQTIEEACRMEDVISPAMYGGEHGGDAFGHCLRVGQFGSGEAAGAAQGKVQAAGKLAHNLRSDSRFWRAEGGRAGTQRHGGQEVSKDDGCAGAFQLGKRTACHGFSQ